MDLVSVKIVFHSDAGQEEVSLRREFAAPESWRAELMDRVRSLVDAAENDVDKEAAAAAQKEDGDG